MEKAELFNKLYATYAAVGFVGLLCTVIWVQNNPYDTGSTSNWFVFTSLVAFLGSVFAAIVTGIIAIWVF